MQTTTPTPAPASSTPEDRATTFQPVQGGGETRSGSALLVEAYAVLWVILMAWLWISWRKQAALHFRLEQLERALDRAAAEREKGKSRLGPEESPAESEES